MNDISTRADGGCYYAISTSKRKIKITSTGITGKRKISVITIITRASNYYLSVRLQYHRINDIIITTNRGCYYAISTSKRKIKITSTGITGKRKFIVSTIIAVASNYYLSVRLQYHRINDISTRTYRGCYYTISISKSSIKNTSTGITGKSKIVVSTNTRASNYYLSVRL